jgi:hypothetical protein
LSGTTGIVAATNLQRLINMAKKKQPVIPEPSPRFVKWSAVVAAVMLIGIVMYDYAIGARDLASPEAAQAAAAQDH